MSNNPESGKHSILLLVKHSDKNVDRQKAWYHFCSVRIVIFLFVSDIFESEVCSFIDSKMHNFNAVSCLELPSLDSVLRGTLR